MEQREPNAESKALGLIEKYVKKFRSMDYTLHPSDIPGESAGKGSNIGWAARKLSAKYPMNIRKDIILTGIDCECAPDTFFLASGTAAPDDSYLPHDSLTSRK
jgi:hypothetical protein